jgi:hypothetical protein
MVSVLMVDGVCPPAGVLVVSQLCFGGRWRLGGTLAACLQVLTVFGDVLVVLKKQFVFGVKRRPRQYQIGVNGDVKLCYWGCMLG